MNNDRTGIQLPDFFQIFNQTRQIMPVNRADVFESHLLEQNTGDKKIFRKRLHPADELNQMMAARQMAQKELDMSLKSVVAAPGDEFRQAGGDGPDTFRDRHLVVVDNQDGSYQTIHNVR